MDKTNYSALTYIGLCIIFTVIGQLLVKHGVLQVSTSKTMTVGLVNYILRTFTNVWVIIGLLSAVVAAVAWTMALSRCQLSFAYPFMGLAIVLVLALSGIVFQEHSTMTRWVGVLIVCLGLFVASRG
ncbi:MAG: EamA family transporter [Armatimonadota bacterium]